MIIYFLKKRIFLKLINHQHSHCHHLTNNKKENSIYNEKCEKYEEEILLLNDEIGMYLQDLDNLSKDFKAIHSERDELYLII